jgi:hypothetical protein
MLLMASMVLGEPGTQLPFVKGTGYGHNQMSARAKRLQPWTKDCAGHSAHEVHAEANPQGLLRLI